MNYTLEIPEGKAKKLAIGWFYLAIGSLVVGGLLSLMIALSRTPGAHEFLPWEDFFHTAIVIHVDHTVLVWFISFIAVLWSINSTSRGAGLGWTAIALSLLGAVIFTLAPLTGEANPLMNNYVPVLQNPVFLTGLTIYGAGFAMLVLRGLLFSNPVGNFTSGPGVLRVGMLTALLAAAMSLIALLISFIGIPADMAGLAYYERLFWGGGHILQFTHTQMLLVVWLWLASVSGVVLNVSPRVILVFVLLGFIPVLHAPFIYLFNDVNEPDHIMAMTKLMQYGNGIGALFVGAVITLGIFRSLRGPGSRTPERIALISSIILFTAGGVIGYLISGINVTIPAHYHGSIVGVTIAFMGMSYYLLPRFGYQITSLKLAKIQPAILCLGQLCHIIGLAWSGGYGVQRKTAGTEQGLDEWGAQMGMKLVGTGAGIAFIGGLLFLYVVLKALLSRKKH